jgi:hypothetical protein
LQVSHREVPVYQKDYAVLFFVGYTPNRISPTLDLFLYQGMEVLKRLFLLS